MIARLAPRLVNVAIGLWLMAAPDVLGYGDPAESNDRILGPMVVAFSFVAIWEVTRGLRFANLPIAAWLVVAPLVLGYNEAEAIANSLVAGGAIALVALQGGRTQSPMGGGWSVVWRG